MAAQPTTMVSVKMLYVLPAPRTIWASDDPNDDETYITHYDPDVDLVAEVFAKLLAYQRDGTPVQLMIEDSRYIVRDPNFPIPDVTAHLAAARSAATAMHDALNHIETAISPRGATPRKPRTKPTRSQRAPKPPPAKKRKAKPKKKKGDES